MKLNFVVSLLLIVALAAGAWARSQKPVSDGAITDLVRRKLADDIDVKGGALQVDVQNGVVTLRGKVETEKQKSKAEKLTRKVSGVKQVNNELSVVGKGNR